MIMENNNDNKVLNVPHLRFPEFTEEWVNVSLKDVADFQKERISSGLLDESTYISTENILQNFQGVQSAISIPANTNVVAYKKNDILLSNIRPYLKKVWFSDRIGGCSADVFVLRSKTCEPEFLYNVIASDKFINYVMSGAKGVKMPRGDKNQMESFSFSIPAVVEQRKISRLFQLLDERIVTQNKIIEDLKKLKSAIIEKTFNENYSNKIRLRDVGSYIRGLTYSSDDVVESNGIFVMRSNNIINGSSLDYHNNIVSVNKQILTEQQLQTGDIVICMANGSSSLVGKSSFYDGDCSTPITVGAFCGIYRSKEPIVKWLFQTNKYRRYIWNSLQGGNGAIANLNGDDILRMSFSIPATPAKDNRIKLLTSVDTLLESNISLCDLYISQKLYLLRQMFI
ncbi:restriction endonuclease subunit S [Bacteroides ovatus]|nr:restriction endonuclease subunit S [Bacteroides ovatus]KAA4565858.1 restriction endonuclease subunit S [Bacteroides ovatus]KAA4598651.1 restriction endonuclease subunit S [Bacteroides ovatus]KAA4611606.1 restriction endonuclease subunit S [Bacteroides ovatus]KAA4633667.1 restriction endonuclease subunit S [Bacteroides ovatus]